jgi:hypothetical protein
MAYGVKFRLDFDDVLGNGKRIEILKDGYVGDPSFYPVYPLIGRGDPVLIKWDADDDFYSPIIGSTCTLNLFQTDDTQYDTFFDAEEKEYKVVISTAQTVSDIYKERVQQDGGFVEAKSCIDSTITGYYDTESYFNKRVLDDGGVTENLDCIGEVLTVERRNIFTTYWAGWLVTDQVSEVMAPNPQPLTLTALDGLGTLDNYNPVVETSTSTIIDRIAEALNEIDLDLDFYVNNDIKQYVTHPYFTDVYYPIEQYEDNNYYYDTAREGLKYEIFDKDYNIYNSKEFLELILQNINARVYQSNGKWVIANNSTYSEIRVQDDVQEILQDTSTLPTDIEQRRLNYLKGKTEFTEFRKYLDTSQSSYTTYNFQALNNIKTDVLPLYQSLVREVERPYKKINLSVEQRKNLSQYNTSFEYGTEFYINYSGSTSNYDIVKSGTKSWRTSSSSTGSGEPTSRILTTNKLNSYVASNATNNIKVKDFKPILSFDYYIDTGNTDQSSGTAARVWYKVTATDNFSNVFYYNVEDNEWTSSSYMNYEAVDTNQADKWLNKSITADIDASGFGSKVNSYVYKLEFYRPYRGGMSGYNYLYLDNVKIKQNHQQFFDRFINTNSYSAVDFFPVISKASVELNSTTNNLEKELKIPVILKNYNHNLKVGATAFAAKYPQGIAALPYFEEQKLYTSDGDVPRLHEAILKQKINDFKTPIKRYEGTLYNNNSQPLSMLSKVWVNFGENILQEVNSCIMDSLEYNVKKNEYDVVMHLPNSDAQLNVTIAKEEELIERS